MKEELLLDVKVDFGNEFDKTSDAITKVTNRNKSLREELRMLQKLNRSNTQEYKDLNKELVLNQQEVSQLRSSQKNLLTVIQSENKSIQQLRAENRLLTNQRNQLNTSTEEGRAKIALLNKEIDKNNTAIKENLSGLEQQKDNVGNYQSALDKVSPALGAFISGIMGATKAAKAFIATPLGAALALIATGLALYANALQMTEQGEQRAIQKKYALDAVWGVFRTNLANSTAELLGWNKAVDKSASSSVKWTGILTGVTSALRVMSPQLAGLLGITEDTTKELVNAAAEGAKVGQMFYDLAESEIAALRPLQQLNTELAKQEEIIRDTEKATGDRNKAYNEATRLINQIFDEEEKLAQQRRDTLEAEGGLYFTGQQQRRKIEEANAALDKIQTDRQLRLNALLRQRNQIIRQSRAEEEAARKAEEARLAEEEKQRQRELDDFIKLIDLKKKSALDLAEFRMEQDIKNEENQQIRFQKELELEQFRVDRLLENENLLDEERRLIEERWYARQVELGEKYQKLASDEAVKLAQIERLKAEAKITNAATAFGIVSELTGRETRGGKAAASVEALINTYLGANKAYSSLAGIPVVGPALGIAAAAVAIRNGLANVRMINAQTVPGFAEGGLSGKKIGSNDGKRISRSNGDNLLATVKTGEVILNEDQQRRLGGADTFRKIGVPGFADGGFTGNLSTQQSFNNILRDDMQMQQLERVMRLMKPPVVFVEDIRTGVERVVQIEERAQVI